MNKTDEIFSKQIDQALRESLDAKGKCLSNSIIIEKNKTAKIMYLAQTKNLQIALVTIDIGAQQGKTVKLFPVNFKNQTLPEKIYFEIKQSPFLSSAFAVIAYEIWSQKLAFNSLYLTSIAFSSNQPLSLQFVKIYSLKRQSEKVKDIQWHPYAPLTLLLLLCEEILVFKVDQNPFQAEYSVKFKDLKVSNKDEVIIKNLFQKMSFAQDLNEEENYSSFGKKLSLYLISTNGTIYLLFPFICSTIILDKKEKHRYDQMLSTKISSRRAVQFAKMMSQDCNAKFGKIDMDQQQGSSILEEFSLQINILKSPDVQIFRLGNINQGGKSFSSIQNLSSVQSFRVLTISKHTIFVHAAKTKNSQGVLKIQVFSQEPYQKLLSSQKYSRSQNFNIQTVGQLRIDKVSHNENYRSLQTFSTQRRNDIYLLCNNSICYKISLNGLQRIIDFRSKQDEIENTRLFQVDIMFDSKNEIVTICNTESSFYLLRYLNKNYDYQTIPVESIQLRQKIKKTNSQTEEIFKALVKKNQKIKTDQIKQDQKIDIPELKESTLIQLQEKLATFTSDYKNSVENKIQRIRYLYDGIKSKQAKIHQQSKLKEQIKKLLNAAQQNDKTIRETIQKSGSQMTRTQRQLQRRLKASEKMLEELKDKLAKQSYMTIQDESKRQNMQDCEQQVDGVLGSLEQMHAKLEKKKKQLKTELGY